MRRRLDAELVRRGLVLSRSRAAEAVAEGRVLVGGAPATSAARQVGNDEAITVQSPAQQYVSRGGWKLAGALDAFGLDVTAKRAVDVGASTGGFTDCLLQRGAAHVVAIDVGRGQFAWSLRTDERVTLMERTNVRDLTAAALPGQAAEVLVADLSFISLRTVAPNLLALAAEDGDFVLLVKPQFEAGRARVGRGGIVRDPAVHAAVLHEVIDGLAAAGLGARALVPSSLRGADGNVEFLLHARRGAATVTAAGIAAAVRAAHDPMPSEGAP